MADRLSSPPPIPPRPVTGHKGVYGRVLVVGGSENMIGAPVLAGTAALRMGSGLVQIAVPRGILAQAISITPELIGLGLGIAGRSGRSGRFSEGELVDAARSSDVIVIGPGMGQSADAKARLLKLIRMPKPLVIDADALNILAAEKKWPKPFAADAVLTPHPGEMTRLNKLLKRGKTPEDDEGRMANALAAAKTFGQIVVLKGERTVVSDGKVVYVNATGNSALSKAGAGDVLSGMIASLIGQGMRPFDAACAAVNLHGLAGEIAGRRWGLRSVLARDVIDAIPEAIALYEQRER